MSVFHNNSLIGSSGQSTGYSISRSLRFNSADSANCTRTAGTPTSSGTWTFSGWIKRATLGADTSIIGGRASGTATQIYFKADNTIRWYENAADFSTTAVFRDASSWYHFVFTKNGSTSCTIYVNGVQLQQNTTGIPSTSPLNASGAELYLGVIPTLPSGIVFYAGHYYADLHFIDGQALDPTSFGEFSATTGVWMPKRYAGTYGTNGFKLNFSDNSAATATTLGKDSSGNGNNWTPNNLSVTAGAGNDSLVDVPTNGSEVDTGVGGQVRGNYATLNPLTPVVAAVTLKNGNLQFTTSSNGLAYSTIGVTSGKWYFEYEQTVNLNFAVGVWGNGGSNMPNNSYPTYYWDIYTTSGTLALEKTSGSASGTLGSVALNDVIGVALDIDNTTLYFYRNGSLIQTITGMTISGPLYPVVTVASGTAAQKEGYINFGQRPFAYTAPSGFKALCTANLPAPVITKPSTVMDVKLYTGNGSTQTISGLGFSPDLVWGKGRSNAYNHGLIDSVRGVSKWLGSNTTDAEGYSPGSYVTAFNSDGFSVGSGTVFNENAATYAAWCWDAGSSTVTNTQGSISSQVRANPSAGFSIVGWTGNGGQASIGHGLGAEPHLIIHKFRGGVSNWSVYTKTTGAGGRLILNSTAAFSSDGAFPTTPTSSLFYIAGGFNDNGVTMLAYCFAPVAGYSSFGSYTGNGSSDGPFVYTGFRPKYVLVKGSSAVTDWWVNDSVRSAYNQTANNLVPNGSAAEYTGNDFNSIDILSNGFKMRNTNTSSNANGGTYIYAAFAESPFQYARAR